MKFFLEVSPKYNDSSAWKVFSGPYTFKMNEMNLGEWKKYNWVFPFPLADIYTGFVNPTLKVVDFILSKSTWMLKNYILSIFKYQVSFNHVCHISNMIANKPANYGTLSSTK